ncbi:CesT family type III secretion system chaperone [Rhizobacter sp. SG703]|uniref:CesT family type III secretion system chaperone n=1 Tax=Rhizobacter sp. SG703 TaxID=2587140 RepID=UPI001446BA47|nr:CesT family type III secretion system chaperone [Rhizobacter sp. SG703]NKI94044.1 hypothetical protein [Rhizobacter sp. SG703]
MNPPGRPRGDGAPPTLAGRPRHRGLAQYLERNGLGDGAPRSDGSIALEFGNRLRVMVRPGFRGDVVLECRVAPIDLKSRQGEERLTQALEVAGNRWLRTSETLVLSPELDMLMLQQTVPSDSGADEFERNLHAFLDAVGFWRRYLGVL